MIFRSPGFQGSYPQRQTRATQAESEVKQVMFRVAEAWSALPFVCLPKTQLQRRKPFVMVSNLKMLILFIGKLRKSGCDDFHGHFINQSLSRQLRKSKIVLELIDL